ncbi:phage head-tail connector protein [Streptomyces bungoensis]|uniref:phage head-tail connector protein n=1 Tax=Streptomyces bungoensis TaxID=285568 RepID=UPI00343DF22C
MGIVTLAAAKKQLNIDATDTSDDLELQLYIDAVTTPVERELGKVVEQRTIVDELDCGSGTTQFMLRSVPAVSLTSIAAVDGSATWSVDPAVMHLNGSNGRVTVLSGLPLSGPVAITYVAGDAIVPANVQLAALIIVQHLWETQRGRGGMVAGGGGEFTMPAGYALPNRACELLGTQLPGIA